MSSQNAVTKLQSDVQVDLQRRYDLIPNVVNSVKGYKSEIFEKIAEAPGAKITPGNASFSSKAGPPYHQLCPVYWF